MPDAADQIMTGVRYIKNNKNSKQFEYIRMLLWDYWFYLFFQLGYLFLYRVRWLVLPYHLVLIHPQ